MAKIRAAKRRTLGAKKLDMTGIRAALQDRRQWCTVGVVTKQKTESSHYQLVEKGGSLVDILVDVELMPEGIDVTCRLAGGAGAQGLWMIPAEGDEVIVMIPAGDISFMPVIVGMLSTYEIADDASQGPELNRTVIVNGAVYIHDGSGGAEELVKKSAYEAHIHSTGVGPSGTPNNAASASSYTEILKAK